MQQVLQVVLAVLAFSCIVAAVIFWVMGATEYRSTCRAGHTIKTTSKRKNEAWWADHTDCETSEQL